MRGACCNLIPLDAGMSESGNEGREEEERERERGGVRGEREMVDLA